MSEMDKPANIEIIPQGDLSMQVSLSMYFKFTGLYTEKLNLFLQESLVRKVEFQLLHKNVNRQEMWGFIAFFIQSWGTDY